MRPEGKMKQVQVAGNECVQMIRRFNFHLQQEMVH